MSKQEIFEAKCLISACHRVLADIVTDVTQNAFVIAPCEAQQAEIHRRFFCEPSTDLAIGVLAEREYAKVGQDFPITAEEEALWETTVREHQRLHPDDAIRPNGHF